MISVRNAQMFCAEPIEWIENYDKAMADQTQVWHCHHVWETMLGYSKEELIEMNEYYGIPACNLIFLTPSEHTKIHSKGENHPMFGRHHTEETKEKLRKYHLGKHHTEEVKRKMSESRMGEKNNFYGKHHTEETKQRLKEQKINGKLSKPVLQYTKNGDFVKEYPSLAEAERQLGFDYRHLSNCATGKRKTAYGFIWKYKN